LKLKQLGTFTWGTVRNGGATGVPVGHITLGSSFVSGEREGEQRLRVLMHLIAGLPSRYPLASAFT